MPPGRLPSLSQPSPSPAGRAGDSAERPGLRSARGRRARKEGGPPQCPAARTLTQGGAALTSPTDHLPPSRARGGGRGVSSTGGTHRLDRTEGQPTARPCPERQPARSGCCRRREARGPAKVRPCTPCCARLPRVLSIPAPSLLNADRRSSALGLWERAGVTGWTERPIVCAQLCAWAGRDLNQERQVPSCTLGPRDTCPADA